MCGWHCECFGVWFFLLSSVCCMMEQMKRWLIALLCCCSQLMSKMGASVLIKPQTRNRNSYKTRQTVLGLIWLLLLLQPSNRSTIKVLQVQVCCGLVGDFPQRFPPNTFSWQTDSTCLSKWSASVFCCELKMLCSDESTQLLTGQKMQCGISIPFPWVAVLPHNKHLRLLF